MWCYGWHYTVGFKRKKNRRRSKIYIATKVNPMGIGAENEARGVAPHGYDSEIVTWQGIGIS